MLPDESRPDSTSGSTTSAPGTGYLDVVGGVIVRAGRVLCTQRGPGGPAAFKWEFPGGKVEPGESPEAALTRELREELGVDVIVGPQFTHTQVRLGLGTVRLTTYVVTLPPEAKPVLHAHQAAAWLTPPELGTLDWADADKPTVQLLGQAFNAGQKITTFTF